MRNNAAYLPENPIVYIIFPESIHNRASFGIFVKPHRRYLLRKMRSRISVRMDMMNRCLSGREVDRDGLLYISCVANSYMGYMRHMNCHRFKRVLVERNVSFSKRGDFRGEELVFVPFLTGFALLFFPFFRFPTCFLPFFPYESGPNCSDSLCRGWWRVCGPVIYRLLRGDENVLLVVGRIAASLQR